MDYFTRKIDAALLEWKNDSRHKPLMLRGARQIGKTSAVRNLGKTFKYYVEINFEDTPQEINDLFQAGSSPQKICEKLSEIVDTTIIAGETLVFFDEIQEHPPVLSRLRYFYEQYPELHVIAAGSLLEFALEEIPSFGVGRIDTVFMYPFSFREFLLAEGRAMWAKLIGEATPEKPLSAGVHKKLLDELQTFLIIGGMPEVVAEYVRTHDFLRCRNVLNSLLVMFRNDFAKYKKRIPAARINEVFTSVAHQAEGKFVYEHVSQNLNNEQVKISLQLLLDAGLCYQITHSSANGVPLGANINPKYRRIFPFDTGLCQRILNLDVSRILLSTDFDVINKGAIAEIFVASELKKAASCYVDDELYCWVREKKKANAQIDFVVQQGQTVVPIEVKSGSSGRMQSMWQFLKEKNSGYGIRTSLENFAEYDKIKVYPLYAIGNVLKE
ncbi:MAG: AAA family ATPase [Prevotellaceae bacterium]|jgi:predicted AAA+ superfamily ATPase|nr:AAA family ATPase [Prevotellaceae bacterium]